MRHSLTAHVVEAILHVITKAKYILHYYIADFGVVLNIKAKSIVWERLYKFLISPFGKTKLQT